LVVLGTPPPGELVESFVVPVYAADGGSQASAAPSRLDAAEGALVVPRVATNGAGQLPGAWTGTSILGALIAAAGVAAIPSGIFLLSWGIISALPSMWDSFASGVVVIAVLVVSLGGGAAYFGLRSVRRRRARDAEIRAATQGGATRTVRRGLLTRRICAGFWMAGLFVAVAGPIAYFSPPFRIPFACVVLGVTVAVARVWLQGGLEIRRPLEGLGAGRRSTLVVTGLGGPGVFTAIDVVLRCLCRPAGARADAGVTEVCRFEATVPGPLDAAADEPLILAFDLPPDAPPSGVNGSVAADWQLIVGPSTEWGRFFESFEIVVVPATSQPQSGAAESPASQR
jgi:heme exporter protein D